LPARENRLERARDLRTGGTPVTVVKLDAVKRNILYRPRGKS
jgi:hypothetical protein